LKNNFKIKILDKDNLEVGKIYIMLLLEIYIMLLLEKDISEGEMKIKTPNSIQSNKKKNNKTTKTKQKTKILVYSF
jgi:hypothetical protein